MALPAFDTHAFIKKLTAAGMPMQQAEAQVEFQNQVLSELITEKLATKEDIANLDYANKENLIRIESKIKEEFTCLEQKIDILEVEVKSDFKLIKWIGTFLLTGVVTILFKLFHT